MQALQGSVIQRNDVTDPSTNKDDLNAAINVPVTVRDASNPAGGGVLSSTFDINGSPVSNPTTTDNNGNYLVYVTDGSYDVIANEGLTNETVEAGIIAGVDLSQDLSQAYIFDTVALYQASTVSFPVGKTIHLNDRNADFTIITGISNDNGRTVIASASVNQSLDYISTQTCNADQLGGSVVIYISTSGSDGNHGFSEVMAKASVQGAFDLLDLLGDSFEGSFEISIDDGSYDTLDATLINKKFSTRLNVTAKNEVATPGVPTVILSGASSNTGGVHGIRLVGAGVFAYVKSIKFTGYTVGGNNRGGLLVDQGADVATENVHADNSSWFGIYASQLSRVRINGGKMFQCRKGIETSNSQVSIAPSSGLLADGLICDSCTEEGVHWSRGTQGHVDYVLFQDNAKAISVTENSRVAAVGNDYKRNTVAVLTETSGQYGESPAVPSEFNEGTVDENVTNIINRGGADYNGGYEDASLIFRGGYDRQNRVPAANTNKQIMSTPYTIPAAWFTDIYKELRIKVEGIQAVSGGTTILGVDFGNNVMSELAFPSATAGAFTAEFNIYSNTRGVQRVSSALWSPLSGARTANNGRAVDMTLDTDVNITMTLGNAANDYTITRVTVDVCG